VDTRQKIIPAEEAVAAARRLDASGRRLVVVIGHFDPLLCAHARALGQVRNGTGSPVVMVVLVPTEAPLLGERARAEMAAALDVVDYVVIMGRDNFGEFVDRLAAEQVILRQGEDENLKRSLIEYVQRRHSG
jgi:glycerol-3-phosphate cytidylyltransferase-like family protein